MKHFLSGLLLVAISSILVSFTSNTNNMSKNIYDISIHTLMGEPVNLSEFKGKKILFVNVASKCGYTPQYKDLQALSEKYTDQVVVIGIPCNQFGGQEPGGKEEIASFCEKNYGVTFLMTEKVDVKGDKQHPLYAWLTQKAENGMEDSNVKWNFQKYLVSEKGDYIDMFSSGVNPLSEEITSQL
ncbi:MAG: glutathione peroxidase [Halieaceae bacterium]|jgi:glutathione peroxidase